jgi:acylphosphatase
MRDSGFRMLDLRVLYRRHLASSIKYPESWSRPMISLQVFYEGNVQGVGFRWSVRHAAKGFDLTGWVRNLPDGRVELQVNGEEDEVRAFLDGVAKGELHSLIHKQTENKLEKPVTARGFEIRHD